MISLPSPYCLGDARQAVAIDPERFLLEVMSRASSCKGHNIFIELSTNEGVQSQLRQQLQRRARGMALPLLGIPIAVKDNIDVRGFSTTAGCPAFAYQPDANALSVQRLIDAGAIVIGKTNLDQFATGLVGVRSPYGLCRSSIDPDYVCGGSSSGSALAVAMGIVPVALGTDTAGSGRVPAAFNDIVGLKPSRGIVSTVGVVPACRSLDCVSIFSLNPTDAWDVLRLCAAFEPSDAFSRAVPQGWGGCSARNGFRFGSPSGLEFFGNDAYQNAFGDAENRLTSIGGTAVEVPIDDFIQAGQLLYDGPWVAERYSAVGKFIESHTDSVHPVVREIVLGGKVPAAHQLFDAQYLLTELLRKTAYVWDLVDVLAMPTTGTIYRVDEVLKDPLITNKNLGRYTNFVNLLDLAGIAIPVSHSSAGAPFGITLLGPAFSEAKLVDIAERFIQ